MITFLHGTLVEALPHQAVVEVGGVGYELSIPLSTYDALGPAGGTVRVLTHLHVREDAHVLFGFARSEERDLFRLLIDRVSGVGPRVALSVLGGMPVSEFQRAVVEGDVAALARIKGLGRKTAERIILELKDKVGVAEAWRATRETPATPLQGQLNDAVLALISLGYRQPEALKAVRQLEAEGRLQAGPTVDQILREALRLLN